MSIDRMGFDPYAALWMQQFLANNSGFPGMHEAPAGAPAFGAEMNWPGTTDFGGTQTSMPQLPMMLQYELMALLVQWLLSNSSQQRGCQCGQNLGNMGGSGGGGSFSGGPQPVGWNGGGGGSPQIAGPTPTGMPSAGGGDVQSRLYDAVILQESGGNYSAVNRDSGAMGIGQVMPANIPSWSREALGYEITPQQFLNSPELQDQIVKFKLNQYYEEALSKGHSPQDAVRYVASKWYSGQGENMDSTRPQNGYPSIRDYTFAVLDKFNATA